MSVCLSVSLSTSRDWIPALLRDPNGSCPPTSPSCPDPHRIPDHSLHLTEPPPYRVPLELCQEGWWEGHELPLEVFCYPVVSLSVPNKMQTASVPSHLHTRTSCPSWPPGPSCLQEGHAAHLAALPKGAPRPHLPVSARGVPRGALATDGQKSAPAPPTPERR